MGVARKIVYTTDKEHPIFMAMTVQYHQLPLSTDKECTCSQSVAQACIGPRHCNISVLIAVVTSFVPLPQLNHKFPVVLLR